MRNLFTIGMFLISCFVFAQNTPQQLISSGGAEFTNTSANLNVNTSIGEAVIGAFTSNGIIVTNGFNQPAPYFIVTVTSGNVTCNGGNDGWAQVDVTGGIPPFTYEWNNAETTALINDLTAGNYSVTITDGDYNTTVKSVVITEPDALSFDSESATDISCFGANDGIIEVVASGGTGTLEYSIDDGTTWQGSGYFDGITPDCYAILVRDVSNCQQYSSMLCINEPDEVVVDLGGDQTVCTGQTVTLDAGSFSSYYWSTLESTQTIDVTAANTYSVTVTDAYGCNGSDVMTLTLFTLPVADLGDDDAICDGDNAILNPGTFSSYTWSTGQTTQAIVVTTAATYSVTVTDGNGCTDADEMVLSVNLLPIVDLGDDIAICEGESQTMDAGSYNSYFWSTGAITQTINVSAAATYSVTITDGNGCSDFDELVLTVDTMPAINAGTDQTYYENQSPVQLGTTPVLGYVYSWSPSAGLSDASIANPTATPTETTTFYLTVVNGACQDFDDVLVTFVPTYDISGTITYDNTDATVMNGVTVYLYENSIVIDSAISDGDGNYLFAAKLNGNYTISVETEMLWGGVNSTDALVVQRYYTGLELLAEPRLTAADVNLSNYVNSTDALLIKRRFAGLITSFLAGDWYFNPLAVVIANADVSMNFKAICIGDVNGSKLPPFAKSTGTVNLTSTETMIVTSGSTLDLQVRVGDVMQAGAVSLVFTYPQDIEVLSVNAVATGMTGVITNITNDKVFIAWNDLQVLDLQENDILFTLSVRILGDNSNEIEFGLLPQSEFADGSAHVIEGVNLYMPSLIIGTTELIATTSDAASMNIYPNPVTKNTVISYFVPQAGDVTISLYDVEGRMVNQVLSQHQAAGSYSLLMKNIDLAEGVYNCFFTLDNGSKIVTDRKSIVIIK